MRIFFFKLIKNIYIFLFSDKKFVFIFNYHQIYLNNKKEGIECLHSVKLSNFKTQIKIMSILGSFISLDDLISYNIKSKINFIITFDDVPSSFKIVKDLLHDHSIPVLLCPSYKITNNGYGWRNKVYKIIEIMNSKQIFNEVKKLDIKYELSKSENFYSFTKSNDKNSIYVENNVIDPLYEKLVREKNVKLKINDYLDWDYYKKNILKSEYIEIVNHSFNHYNMSTLSREQIFDDFRESDVAISEKLGLDLKYFAVPFGTVTNNLLVDLNDIANQLKYKAVMWITNSANIVVNKKNNQIHHLGRIHTPDSIPGFIKTIISSFARSEDNIITNSKEDSYVKSELKLYESNDLQKSTSIENILRPNKDFASDPLYFSYLYEQNIFKGIRSHYSYMDNNGRVESILYNFHAEFYLAGKKYKGVYWAGGRSLPFSKVSKNASLFLKSLKEEPIIGSYKPNAYFQKGLKNWKKISMYEIQFSAKILNLKNKKNNFFIKVNDKATDELDSILQFNQKNIFFYLSKSKDYYAWRYDKYCYAKTKYYILYRDSKPSSFLLVQWNKGNAHLTDFSFFSIEELQELIITAVNDLCKSKIFNIIIESNKTDIVSLLKSIYKINIKNFSIYYYFNKKYFKNESINFNNNFIEIKLNETQTCGDVLIR